MNTENKESRKRLPASERKKIILEAALTAFSESGYHATTMDAIAERARVTKPILYRHFPGKLELFLAVLEQSGEDLRNKLLEPVAEGLDWKERTRHSIRSYLEFVSENKRGFRLIYTSDVQVNTEVTEIVNRIRERQIEAAVKIISSYTDTGRFPVRDVEMVAAILVGMIESTAKRWLERKDRPLGEYEDFLTMAATSILAKLPPRRR